MQRNPSESKQHSDLIQMMVNHFSCQGYRNIKTGITGMTSHDIIHMTKQNLLPD